MIFVKAVQVFWVFFQSSSQFSQVKAGHKSISILDVCFLNSFSPSQKDPKSCLLLSVVWYNFWFSDPNFLVGNCQIQEIIFGSLTPISCDRYQKKRGKAMAAGAVVSLVATTKIRLFSSLSFIFSPQTKKCLKIRWVAGTSSGCDTLAASRHQIH